MTEVALVTGITGQDGSYLAELLIRKGYEVHGLVRPGSSDTRYVSSFAHRLKLHYVDLGCSKSIDRLVEYYRPSEIYHLASPSFVPRSWDDPVAASEIIGTATVRLLEAIRRFHPTCRFYLAGSSEMFGNAQSSPQSEESDFRPTNPYAAAKLYAHHIVENFRERHGIFACTGLLFNHESPRRGREFVTRKITMTAAAIKLELANELRLGNLESTRDWGFAGDFVESMWLMLQQSSPRDFVIGTGRSTTVREFAEAAFALMGLDYQDFVMVDPAFYRPTERYPRVANPKKAIVELGWRHTTTLIQLISMMVHNDLLELRSQPNSILGAA